MPVTGQVADSCASGKPFGASTTNQASGPGQSTTQQPSLGQPSSTPQIDIVHIRSTTKFDHLQKLIQDEISQLDNAILNSQKTCEDLGNLLASVRAEGSQQSPGVDYVTTKLEELEQGLENDAEAIVAFREGENKRDEGEAKCVFRVVDRLKVPRQYQVAEQPSGNTSVLGTSTMNSTGLSGWWNQPQTLRGMRSTAGVGGQSVQLVSEDVDDSIFSGPKNLIDLFDARAEGFAKVNEAQKRLLSEIEDFVEGLEEKVITKEREVNERLNYGNAHAAGRREEEKERQMNQLRFVFGEVQRGLFDAADKVSTTRDGIVELGLLR